METGTEVEVRGHFGNLKTVKVSTVSRGRVTVHWPHVGEFEVDMQTGELVKPPESMSGVHSLEPSGRVVGTRTHVAPGDLHLLEELALGTVVRLDNGAVAEVVDVLQSEGAVKIFVQPPPAHASGLHRAERTSYFVMPAALARLRESAGILSEMAG